MPIPTDFSFTRYLAAKKSVDDRALNRFVLQRLIESLPQTGVESPLKVLEIGAGIGTMVERLLAWSVLKNADYTAVDLRAENSAYGLQRLPEWGLANEYDASRTPDGEIELKRQGCLVTVRFETMDLYDFARTEVNTGQWDLLIAHAFLDVVDAAGVLALLFRLLKADGLFYFTLNFDGATILEPTLDRDFDAVVESLYHQSMDERQVGGRKSGDSRTGRHLFDAIRLAGGQVLEAGSSDWVVFPGVHGYSEDETYFLHYILHTMHTALLHHPELDRERFEAWVAGRHTQVERGELVYIAHQLDFFGNRS